jgi:hypothetical protein
MFRHPNEFFMAQADGELDFGTRWATASSAAPNFEVDCEDSFATNS